MRNSTEVASTKGVGTNAVSILVNFLTEQGACGNDSIRFPLAGFVSAVGRIRLWSHCAVGSLVFALVLTLLLWPCTAQLEDYASA